MGTYLYNGPKIDILPVMFGFVLYVDDDLTPVDADSEKVYNIISNGSKLNY